MDIFSFPIGFPQSQPNFNPNLFDAERVCDYSEQLKEREAQLEARRKYLCFGGKEDNEHIEASSVNRNDYPPLGEEDASDDDEEMHSTSSYSFNEASEGGQEDDVDEEIPFDDSEVDEVLQTTPQGGGAVPHPALADEIVEEEEVEVGWADTDTEDGSSQSDA